MSLGVRSVSVLLFLFGVAVGLILGTGWRYEGERLSGWCDPINEFNMDIHTRLDDNIIPECNCSASLRCPEFDASDNNQQQQSNTISTQSNQQSNTSSTQSSQQGNTSSTQSSQQSNTIPTQSSQQGNTSSTQSSQQSNTSSNQSSETIPAFSHQNAADSSKITTAPSSEKPACELTEKVDATTHVPLVLTKSYTDRRDSLQPSPRGYVCMNGYFGRLNNMLLETSSLIEIALKEQRTALIPLEVSRAYKVSSLNNLHPELNYTLVAPHDKVLCANATLVDAPELFRYKRLDLSSMFKYLEPMDTITREVEKYVQETFNYKPFVAVHIRWLEGNCIRNMRNESRKLCSPTPDLVRDIVRQMVGDYMDPAGFPVFVAHDGQQPELVAKWKEAGARFFTGACRRTACAVADFEVAARANIFIGARASTAAFTISQLRLSRFRGVGTVYPAVLGIPPERSTRPYFRNNRYCERWARHNERKKPT